MTKKQDKQRFIFVKSTMQYIDNIHPKDEQQGT